MPIPRPWKAASDGPNLSEGGQAHIYAVSRDGDEDVYVMKRLKNATDQARRARFDREMRTMRELAGTGLNVPDIVQHDSDAVDRPWFVMPWFRRGSLQSLIDEEGREFLLVERILMFEELCALVRAVHDTGTAHRDLKPANVLIGEDGSLYLSDFGLAMNIDDDRLTVTREAIGSRHYIAPENENGIFEDVDQRPADVYALGKIGWVLLAGEPVRAREEQSDPERRLATLHDDPRLASLDTVLSAMTTRDVRRRTRDWEVLLNEISAARQRLAPLEDHEEQPDKFLGIAAAALLKAETSEVTRQAEQERELDAQVTERWQVFATAFISAYMAEVDAFVTELQKLSSRIRLVVGQSGPVLENMIPRFPELAELDAVRDACKRHVAIGGIAVHHDDGIHNRSFDVNLYGVIIGESVRIFQIVVLRDGQQSWELPVPPHFPRLTVGSARLGWPTQDTFIEAVVRESAPVAKALVATYLGTLNVPLNVEQLGGQLAEALADHDPPAS